MERKVKATARGSTWLGPEETPPTASRTSGQVTSRLPSDTHCHHTLGSQDWAAESPGLLWIPRVHPLTPGGSKQPYPHSKAERLFQDSRFISEMITSLHEVFNICNFETTSKFLIIFLHFRNVSWNTEHWEPKNSFTSILSWIRQQYPVVLRFSISQFYYFWVQVSYYATNNPTVSSLSIHFRTPTQTTTSSLLKFQIHLPNLIPTYLENRCTHNRNSTPPAPTNESSHLPRLHLYALPCLLNCETTYPPFSMNSTTSPLSKDIKLLPGLLHSAFPSAYNNAIILVP